MSDQAANDVTDLTTSPRTEKVMALAQVVSSAVPWIGGPVSNVLGGFTIERKMRRVDDCLKELVRRIEHVSDEAAKTFVKTDEFEDILEETLRRVSMESREEKRRVFASFLANAVVRPKVDHEMRLALFKALDQLRPSHLSILKALAQAPTREELNRSLGSIEGTLLARVPLEKGADLHMLVSELENLQIVEHVSDRMRVTMSGSGAADLGGCLTDFGRSLLTFLSDESA